MRGWCSTAGPRPRSPGRSSRSAWGSEWAPPGWRSVPVRRGRAPSYSPRVISPSATAPSATPRNDAARAVERTYLVITLLSTLASSFIWGINTIFLVDALPATGFQGHLEHVFGRAQAVGGGAMLVGTVAGGVVAQLTNLGVPYLIPVLLLGVSFVVALLFITHLS